MKEMATLPRRKRQLPPAGAGGNLLVDVLTSPVLGVPRFVTWIGKKVKEAMEMEVFDEGAVQGALTDLQLRYEVGEVAEEKYLRQEAALLERLTMIREAKGIY